LCKRQGIECVPEQLLASQEGLFCVILFVIRFNALKVIGLKISKAAAVLFVLMKVYTIPCNDRGHINVVLVLQSCTDCLQVMAGSSADTFPTPSDCTYGVGNIKVEEDIYVVEESFIAIKEESDTGIKQEEMPEDVATPDVNPEPEQVNYICICLFRHI
jgi:hypothetical protein